MLPIKPIIIRFLIAQCEGIGTTIPSLQFLIVPPSLFCNGVIPPPTATSVIYSPSGNNRVFSPSLNQMVFG